VTPSAWLFSIAEGGRLQALKRSTRSTSQHQKHSGHLVNFRTAATHENLEVVAMMFQAHATAAAHWRVLNSAGNGKAGPMSQKK
jgi:hypothetical protein